MKSFNLLIILLFLTSCLEKHEIDKIRFVQNAVQKPDSLVVYLSNSEFKAENILRIMNNDNSFLIGQIEVLEKVKKELISDNYCIHYEQFDYLDKRLILPFKDSVSSEYLVQLYIDDIEDWNLDFHWVLIDTVWYFDGMHQKYSLNYMNDFNSK